MSVNTNEICYVVKRTTVRHFIAWIMLCLSLAIHLLDEIITSLFSNHTAVFCADCDSIQLFNLPFLTFEVWLTLWVEAVLVLISLSPFAYIGARWMVLLSYPFAIVAATNGLLDMANSVYLMRVMPGLFSSPLLLSGAIYLLVKTSRLERIRE